MSASTLRARLQRDAQAVVGPYSLPTRLEPLHLRKLLLPDPTSAAALPVAKAIWNSRMPVAVHTAPGNADRYEEALRDGGCIPLGGPDYARRCMSLLGISEPQMNCYPKVLLANMLHIAAKGHRQRRAARPAAGVRQIRDLGHVPPPSCFASTSPRCHRRT